jgi:hypothetical protein
MTIADKLTEMYVGYFNRAPDPAGLYYWFERVKAGATLEDVAKSFASSPEAVKLYPFLADGTDATMFVRSVYQNLFDREPDPEGLAYWTQQVAERGAGPVILTIMSSAVAEPDRSTLDNKAEVGLYYAREATVIPFQFDDSAHSYATRAVEATTTDDASIDVGKSIAWSMLYDSQYIPGLTGLPLYYPFPGIE